MDLSLTMIAVIVIAIIVLKIATKLISKVFGILIIAGLVLGYMYHKSLGPFKENVANIEILKAKYCQTELDDDICSCIINTVERDMQERFTTKELDSISNQRIKGAYVLKKSLAATKNESISCLEERGAAEKYKAFLQDFIPIENDYLNIVDNKAQDFKNKLKEEYQSFIGSKKDIDSKY